MNNERFKISNTILNKIEKIVDKDSYYTKKRRKPRSERIDDNVKWYQEHGFINTSYNIYGLDIINFKDQNDYLEKETINKNRALAHNDILNTQRNHSMINHKLYFFILMNQWLKEQSLELKIMFQNNNILFPISNTKDLTTLLLELEDGRYLCKSIETKKERFFSFIKKDNDFFINNNKISLLNFKEKTKNKKYIIHPFIESHQQLKNSFGNGLVRVKIDTERWHDSTDVFYAYLKFKVDYKIDFFKSSKKYSYIGINLKNGRLMKYGEYKNNPRSIHTTRHPKTKRKYENTEVPYWNECINLVYKLHNLFNGFPSIEWELMITDNGPVVIDATSESSIELAQLANGGLKSSWHQLVDKEKK